MCPTHNQDEEKDERADDGPDGVLDVVPVVGAVVLHSVGELRGSKKVLQNLISLFLFPAFFPYRVLRHQEYDERHDGEYDEDGHAPDGDGLGDHVGKDQVLLVVLGTEEEEDAERKSQLVYLFPSNLAVKRV